VPVPIYTAWRRETERTELPVTPADEVNCPAPTLATSASSCGQTNSSVQNEMRPGRLLGEAALFDRKEILHEASSKASSTT